MSSFEDFIKTWRGGYLVETDNDHSNAQYAAALAAWRAAQPKWQPIESAPEFKDVLVKEITGHVYIAERQGNRWWQSVESADIRVRPVKWMPIPE